MFCFGSVPDVDTRSKPQASAAAQHLTQQCWEMCRENQALHYSNGENQALVRIHTDCTQQEKVSVLVMKNPVIAFCAGRGKLG